MKTIFNKKLIVLMIFLAGVQQGFAQQKVRTSERNYQQEFQKARKMKEHRDNMINKMGKRDVVQSAPAPSTIQPVSTKPLNNQQTNTRPVNSLPVQRKQVPKQ